MCVCLGMYCVTNTHHHGYASLSLCVRVYFLFTVALSNLRLICERPERSMAIRKFCGKNSDSMLIASTQSCRNGSAPEWSMQVFCTCWHACPIHKNEGWLKNNFTWKILFLAAPFALNIWNTARILLPFNEPDSWQVFWYAEYFSHFLALLHEMDHFSDFFICFGSSKRLYFVISTNAPFVLHCNFNSHPNTTWNCIWPIFVSLWIWTLFQYGFGFFFSFHFDFLMVSVEFELGNSSNYFISRMADT